MADPLSTYIVTAPDGRRFELTGPGNPEAAIAAFQQALGAPGSVPTAAAPAMPSAQPTAGPWQKYQPAPVGAAGDTGAGQPKAGLTDPAGETPLQKFRAKYPQYAGRSDSELATALHSKFYANMPYDDFAARIGLAPAEGADRGAGMSVFEVQGPDGATYEVQAPDMQTAAAAFKVHVAGQPSAGGAIEVELPDGSIAEFPAGTPDATIKTALAKTFGGPQPTDRQRQLMLMQTQARLRAAKDGALELHPADKYRAQAADEQAKVQIAIAQAKAKMEAEASSSPPGAGMDMMQSLGAGVLRGAAGLADLPGAAMNAAGGAIISGLERAGIVGPGYAEGMRASVAAGPWGSGSTAREGAELATGGYSEFQGQTVPGRYAGTVGEFLPGAIVMGGGTVGNALRYGVLPGVASEAAGQATEGTAVEPWARTGAAMVAPLAVNAAQHGLQRLVSPNGGADPARLAAARSLEARGVPVTAGQKVGSNSLRRQEGFTTRGQDMIRAQQEAFTAAAMKEAGSSHKLATPEALADTARQIGGMFDKALSGVQVKASPALTQRLGDALTTYQRLTPASGRAPVLSEVLRQVKAAAKAGKPMDGREVAAWRSALGKLSTSPDAGAREAAVAGIEALDTAIAGAMRGAGRAGDARMLTQARTYWRNFLAVQRAVSGAGEAAASGIVTPSALRGAVATQGRAAYAQGRRGNIGELARAGERILKPLPTSGTAENLRALMATGTPAAALGAYMGNALGGGPGAALGAMVGSAVPGVARALKMTGPGQAYMANQLAGSARNILDPAYLAVPMNALGGLGN